MPTWTPEMRQKQAERIRQWCPWKKSTGPKTAEGKAISSRNAWKGGVAASFRATMRSYREVLRSMEQHTKAALSSFCPKRVKQSKPVVEAAPKDDDTWFAEEMTLMREHFADQGWPLTL